jgi:hypothetical protein
MSRARARRRIKRAVNRRPRRAPRPARRPRRAGNRRRARNPNEGLVGYAPTLYVRGDKPLNFPEGLLLIGEDGFSCYLELGGVKAPPEGAKVYKIDYDDPAKAVEAYGRIDRFTHECESPLVVGKTAEGVTKLVGTVRVWETD